MVLYGKVGDIRRQHAEHAYVVEASEVPAGLPGVRAMERDNGTVKLTLERATAPSDVLRHLLDKGAKVAGFTPVIPPLEDIFVNVVLTGAGLDKGRSGPPTLDEPVQGGGR
jgi:ABC-type uncharacterized transport system ATPase subunit